MMTVGWVVRGEMESSRKLTLHQIAQDPQHSVREKRESKITGNKRDME
jgi:hypothetical protein